MQKTLIVIGIAILLAGLLWPWLARLPIGRLPGDIIIDRPGMKVYIVAERKPCSAKTRISKSEIRNKYEYRMFK
ncbi:MAG: DUF2905 domain-containing protein [Desulfosalsimonas sp.]